MAKLLGPDLTEKHLVPAFAYFLDDVDDVKLGSITHFCDFLARVPPSSRSRFLPELAKFTALPSKFKLKWRFRALVAQQLPSFCTVFDAPATFDAVAPLVFSLSQDDVATVRDASIAGYVDVFEAKLKTAFVKLATSDPVLNVRLLAARILLDVAPVYAEPEEALQALDKETDAEIQAVVARLKQAREEHAAQ
ncbi:hypothetical protein DYB32_004601 [Aphanomyces invadans]|uniref:HEAT repeat-containing protein 1 n=1 Tax=Aphanomyces invadans TaxID=157072 RepID=A0A418AX48_9STRA|nr:hypothetical protein DYB32_004601 [Aphanomyces invadans]